MSFESNLSEFNFNLETLDLMNQGGLSQNEMVDTLKEVGFSSELTHFLLTNRRSLVSSLLLRLKLYNKQSMSYDKVKNTMSKYKSMMPLVTQLFHNETSSQEELLQSSSTNEETHSVSDNEVVEKSVEESVEDSVEEDSFGMFLSECVEINDDESVVKASSVYSAFRGWYLNKFDENVPGKKELKSFLNTKLEKSGKSSWKGSLVSV